MPWIGEALVKTDAPAHADMIVVLAGDGWGYRILKAAELGKQGYAPKVLVSGPDGTYDFWECDLAIDFAERKGYPRSLFIPFRNVGRSTREEASLIIPELRKLGVHRFILVTSDYHTKRAGNIYREAKGDLEMNVVAAPTRFFTPATWWIHREGQKTIFNEWTKTITGWFHI